MADHPVEIPDREFFKSSEVCEIAGVQAYVLRSWESEFPALGVSRTQGGPRVYRRADVERVLQIKRLVFGEGLTLAGARRRIEDAEAGVPEGDAPALVAPEMRRKLAAIKRDMRSLLSLLGDSAAEVRKPEPVVEPAQPTLLELDGGEAKPKRASKAASKSGAARSRA